MEHQKCYLFKPQGGRPAKRRRLNNSDLPSSWPLREATYNELWATQEKRIKDVLSEVNRTTTGEITSFVSASATESRTSAYKIPTGLVVAGPSIASHRTLFEHLGREIVAQTRSAFVLLTSAECPNLKTLLKNLIKNATARSTEEDEDDEVAGNASQKGPKLLTYDLQLLYLWFRIQDLDQLVVAFQDSEAFDGSLLGEAIELLRFWSDRTPFVLLFGIATTVETFENKLPRAAKRCIEGQKFDVTQADEILERVLHAAIDGDDVPLRLGPALSTQLLDRQKDHVQSVDAFVEGLKYAYMSHFYANPLSLLLRKDLKFEQMSGDDFEAVRNLGSFRELAERLLDNGEAALVRSLLDSDAALFNYTRGQLDEGQLKVSSMVGALETLNVLRGCFPKMPVIPLSSLYVRAVSGELNGSPAVRELLISVKKASSDIFIQILDSLLAWTPEDAQSIVCSLRERLAALMESNEDCSTPLRSEHDLRNETLRTTVVAQKVELSKQKSALSKRDAAYSKLVDECHSRLEAYFAEMFINPQEIFLHEIFLYDLKSPHKDAFTPRPRYAVERALSAPQDYLGCDCCRPAAGNDGTESTLSSTQPATTIMYQLYLESGSLINVSDLWSAFQAIMGDDDDEQGLTMALFQRALAELRCLGLIKSSRKKTDHVAKLAWKGL
ncbi:hypothetical protein W97_01264 [Coniosporium apollinis CBS 100218]|uniref:Uncharacterized protein n=1 Tax=Coniosporium apollinis (strain CBS 100218) TaxID=1168221 RepID=R7YJH4_CONA1|nr:uncharacterized protein W97_01264 [Coniosporium apollinis CBS 100218]EON62045.1 hypothetical protein W97_01264 [Coniosporium apollinis CBS 100218]